MRKFISMVGTVSILAALGISVLVVLISALASLLIPILGSFAILKWLLVTV